VNKAGTWYLVATRHAAREQQPGQNGDPAVFRVGRVTSARLLTTGVVRPDGFDLAGFWERWSAEFVTSRSQVEVRVRATATALGIFPYVFGDAGRRAAEAAGPADADGLREVVLTFEEERGRRAPPRRLRRRGRGHIARSGTNRTHHHGQGTPRPLRRQPDSVTLPGRDGWRGCGAW